MAAKPPECSGCPLEHIGTGFAWGEGPITSDLWLVGEALGEDEAEAGRPFIGSSGRFLNALLEKAHIRRSDVYLTNTLRCHPPGNEIWPWLPDAARHCAVYRTKDLERHAPKVIIAVGGVPLKELTGFAQGIYAGRGYVFNDAPIPGVRTIGTLHPSGLMRSQHAKDKNKQRAREGVPQVVIADLRKAAAEATQPPFTSTLTVVRQVRELEDWLASAPPRLSVDIENPGGVLICWGLGYRVSDHHAEGVCVPLFTETEPYMRKWGADEELTLTRMLSDTLSNPSILKVFQNGYGHDVPYLEDAGFAVNNWEDTLLMHHTLYSELPHNLQFIGSVYCRTAPWKGESKEMEEDMDK